MLCSTFGKADIPENEALYQNLIYMSVRRSCNAPTDRPFKIFIMHTMTCCDVIYAQSTTFTVGSIGMTS